MKHAKKIMSFLLALAMVFAMVMPVLAQSESNGSITIEKAVKGQTYTVYKILELESYNPTADAYSYKAAEKWSDFINGTGIKGLYVNVDDDGYVTWNGEADAADFAKEAQKYAADNGIAYEDSEVAAGDSVAFDNLGLGYYLVDSTVGTLCCLDTTAPDVTIQEKNVEPGNVKTVEEDSDNKYTDKNDADIGQTINFKSTITAQAGAQNYVFHDKMSEGLTYKEVTGVKLNNAVVESLNYSVKTEDLSDECTFHVAFTKEFCDTLKANDIIEIFYTATLNENAVVGDTGNKNTSKLSYGEESKAETTPSETTTYTWDISIFKYTKTMADGDDDQQPTETPLSGAKFTLSKNANGTDPISLILKKDNVYRVAKDDENSVITEITTDDTGKFTIEGLDSDTYYLTETEAPSGYNKLSDPITIVINKEGIITVNNTPVEEVKVENNSGSELPSTGGTGTTMFYIIGGILVVGALVLLIAKRRMKSEE